MKIFASIHHLTSFGAFAALSFCGPLAQAQGNDFRKEKQSDSRGGGGGRSSAAASPVQHRSAAPSHVAPSRGAMAMGQRQSITQSRSQSVSPTFTSRAPINDGATRSLRAATPQRIAGNSPKQFDAPRRSLTSESAGSVNRMRSAQSARELSASRRVQSLDRSRDIAAAEPRSLTSRQSATVRSGRVDRSIQDRDFRSDRVSSFARNSYDRDWRSRALHSGRNWRGSADWYPERGWDWHHQHRFFWGGAWVIGDYPAYGYEPVTYVVDSSPPFAPSSTAVMVQQALAERGYYDGPIDGVIGEQTRDAIANFQSDQGLPVSGLIDEDLMSSLGVI